MQTGAWGAYKILKNTDENANFDVEVNYLNRMGLLEQNRIIHYKSKKHFAFYPPRKTASCIMHYIPGDLLHNVQFNSVSPHQAVQYISQLINLVKNLFNKGIVHGDLHGDNVIYNFIENKMYPIDFGESNDVIGDYSNDLHVMLWRICEIVSKNSELKSHLYEYLWEKRGQSSQAYNINIIDYCDEILDHLADVSNAMLESERIYHIGLVDINDCKPDKDKITQLAQCSEVWLVDTGNSATLRDSARARQYLQRKNIRVGNKVFKHSSFAVLNQHVVDMCEARHPGCCVITNDHQRRYQQLQI
jgi:tRNA A-37 threonylcarbamoyl transferase component Bud32